MTVRDYLAFKARECYFNMIDSLKRASITTIPIDRSGFMQDANRTEKMAFVYLSLLNKLPMESLDAHMEGTENVE